jgi:para-nitrobenzyl esterase
VKMRSKVFLTGVMLLAALLAPAWSQNSAQRLTVATASGAVVGQLLPSGARSWLGVPYARAPIGELRWRAPQPLHREGIRNADRFGPECIQFLRPHTLNQYFGEEATSEDCLTLNIWAPGTGVTAALPVIVFIHGGGSTAGSGSMPNYSGEHLATRGAIVVTFNYRLGLLGYIAHPELTREQGGHSGNYGYLDQVAALQWVHDNIAGFGGDPGRVLVYGHSSGGLSVFQHLFSPLSRGLFSAAMLASGCCNFRETSLADGEQIGLALQAALGASDLAAMREVAADRVLAQQSDAQNPSHSANLRGTNLVDGYFVTRPYIEAVQAHQFAVVPLLFSSTTRDNDWGRHPLVSATTVADYETAAEKIYGERARRFLELYPAKQDSEVAATVARVIRDSGMHADSRNCARMFGQFAVPATNIWLALYDHSEHFLPGIRFTDRDTATAGAFHNADTPYWLGSYEAYNLLRRTRDFTVADVAMSAAMSDTLIAFARSGNPSTPATNWPTWSPGNEQRLLINHELRSEKLFVKGMDWLAANPLVPGAAMPCAVPPVSRTGGGS